MKLSIVLCTSAVLMLGAVPAQAQALLDGLLGGGVGSSMVTLGSGDAGSSGVVNLGTGSDNQSFDANAGGDVATASGGADSGATIGLLGGNGRAGLGLGGSGLPTVDLGFGNGGGGGPSGPGGPVGPGVNGNGGLVPGGAFASSGGGAIACQGVSSADLERLILSTRIDRSWQRAQSIDIRKVSVCPELRSWLATALRQTGMGQSLRSAIGADDLLSATFDRSPHSADRVFAVQSNGGQLTAYVY